MRLTRKDLDLAVDQGVLDASRAEGLWEFLLQRNAQRPQFDLQHLLYYFGALLVMGAMGWFMNESWERFGGLGLLLIALAYAGAFASVGWWLWTKAGYRAPGGLLVTLAVWMTPLAIYGLEVLTGIWPQDVPGAFAKYHVLVRGGWLLMEAGTVLAGLLALRFFRFPFLTFPVAFALWYMSMDLTPLLLGREDFSWDERKLVSVCFGLVVLAATYVVDRRTREDFAFWGYLFGLMAFWGGLSVMESHSELGKLAYCGVNVGLLLVSILVQRRVFLVFGSLGVAGYLGHLAWDVFKDSLAFPFVLSLIGLLAIAAGVQYRRHGAALERAVLAMLPDRLRRGLPQYRRGVGTD
ncbi:DUF2157 domain-containing protein [Desulfovibrio sp.]